jgi:hypothetical protein
MTIVDRDGIINGLANNHTDLLIDKAAIANLAATQLASLWRATGIPGQGAIPTTAAICTSALTGALPLLNQTAPSAAYLAQAWYVNTLNSTSIEIHDRLAHMGGLSGTVTTAQGALTLAGLPAGRLGRANYADVQWWLEWYADTGATSANASVAVTYDDNSTGTLSSVSLGASARAGRLFPLRSNAAGKFIKAVNSVTLSASTGTAGGFGITATRHRAALFGAVANKIESFDWAALGLPKIENDACLMLIGQSQGSNTGVVRGGGKIVYG